jgi:hypothetical protein
VGSSPGPWAWEPEDPEDGQPYSLFSKGVPYTESGLSVYFEPGGDATPTDLANLTLIAKAPEMAAMLRELEWSGLDDFDEAGVCPVCGNGKYNGHDMSTPPCRLASLLKELPE